MARILVVDDEAIMTRMLALLLRSEGYEVVATERSDEAAEWIRTPAERIDLLVSDIRMRPVDGMELLRLARQHRPALPVVMVTAYASRETEEEARRLGALDYIAKPFKMDRFLATVKGAVSPGGGAAPEG